MEATIETAIVESFRNACPPTSVATADAALKRMKSLASQRADTSEFDSLGSFLQEFANCVADLFAATSVAVWFRTDSDVAPILQRKVSVGWENVLLDDATDDAHLRLLEFAMEQKTPTAFQPFSVSTASIKTNGSKGQSSVSNPTDSYLLLAPIQFNQSPVAVLELVLGPKPLRKPHEQLMLAYLDWLSWLSEILELGMRQFFDQAGSPLWSALETLQQTSVEVEAIQKQIRDHIEHSLEQLAGQNFGSLEANQSVAKQVHALLDGKGLRVQCSECGAAAILRCQKAGNSKTGAFMFDHYLETGRTFHGGQTTFPKLVVVDKPPRRKSK